MIDNYNSDLMKTLARIGNNWDGNEPGNGLLIVAFSKGNGIAYLLGDEVCVGREVGKLAAGHKRFKDMALAASCTLGSILKKNQTEEQKEGGES